MRNYPGTNLADINTKSYIPYFQLSLLKKSFAGRHGKIKLIFFFSKKMAGRYTYFVA